MAKMGLNYDECDSIKTNINSAMDDAKSVNEDVKSALDSLSDFDGDVFTLVQDAYSKATKMLDSIETFKTDFSVYVDDVKTFDGTFASAFQDVQTFISNFINNSLNVAAAGRDGVYGLKIDRSRIPKTPSDVSIGQRMKSTVKGTYVPDPIDPEKIKQGDINAGNLAKGISYFAIIYGDYQGARTDYGNGVSLERGTADLAGNSIVGVGGMLVASAGTAGGAAISGGNPVAAFAVSYLAVTAYTELMTKPKICGKSVAGWINTGIENAIYAGEDLTGVNDMRELLKYVNPKYVGAAVLLLSW